MMRFNSLEDARAFFNELHTDQEVRATTYYHQQVMDIEVRVGFLPKYLKVFCHETGNFFIIGEGVFVDEGANIGDFAPLEYQVVAKLQQAVARGFLPYAVLAAIYEYRMSKYTGDIYEMFPGIMGQFDRMLDLLM